MEPKPLLASSFVSLQVSLVRGEPKLALRFMVTRWCRSLPARTLLVLLSDDLLDSSLSLRLDSRGGILRLYFSTCDFRTVSPVIFNKNNQDS